MSRIIVIHICTQHPHVKISHRVIVIFRFGHEGQGVCACVGYVENISQFQFHDAMNGCVIASVQANELIKQGHNKHL